MTALGDSTVGRSAQLMRFAMKYRHLGASGRTDAEERAPAEAEAAKQFADDIQAMGPAFIKIGQALSIRPDLLPPAYLDALECLQDDTAVLPFDTIRATVEAELGVRLNAAFPRFDPQPLAAASLAQVHAATLRDGREVVVKVQRPGIADSIRADLGVLANVARAADRFTEQGRRVHFMQWIEEMGETLAEELDYRLEADNLRLFREHLAAYPTLFVPEPIDDLSSQRVLTMDRVHGGRIADAAPLRRIEEPLDVLAADLIRAYLDQIFVHGLVHADPHPGNVLLTERGLGLVDLGMVARLGTRQRDTLLRMLAAAVEGDGEEVATQITALSERMEVFDDRAWTRRCARLIARYATQCGQSGFDSGRMGEGALLIELTRQSVASGLRPPQDIALLGRTLLALEGVTRQLDPEVSPREVVRTHLRSVLAERVAQQTSLRALRSQLADMAELGREFPRQARAVLDTLARNQLRVRISGLEESRLLESLHKIANRITAGLISAALVVAAALVLRIDVGPRLFGYPAIALVLFVIAFVLAITLALSAIFSDRRVSRYRTRMR